MSVFLTHEYKNNCTRLSRQGLYVYYQLPILLIENILRKKNRQN